MGVNPKSWVAAMPGGIFFEIWSWKNGQDLLGCWLSKAHPSEENFPVEKASLINYVASYLQKQQGDELKAYADAYRVNFIPYDWRLNDSKTDFVIWLGKLTATL